MIIMKKKKTSLNRIRVIWKNKKKYTQKKTLKIKKNRIKKNYTLLGKISMLKNIEFNLAVSFFYL